MVAATTRRLGAAHRGHVHRESWPDFAAFDPSPWTEHERRSASEHWAGRARNEHGSVQQFGQLTQVLATACVELELLGVLSRMITDEVRHAELCGRMALAIWPEETPHTGPEPHAHRWAAPRPPWSDPLSPLSPREPGATQVRLAWAAQAILTACCLGETVSEPMLEALVVVTTEPTARAVCRQILRDERLHARFGFEALALLLPRLTTEARASLQGGLAAELAGFERSVCGGTTIEEVANSQLVVEVAAPNLGVLSDLQYATIFYACLEGEIFPKLRDLGFDPDTAWHQRQLA